jgi:carboxypeptidase Q
MVKYLTHIFNLKRVSYDVTVAYRGRGAIEAAKFGAVASLIRSVTPYSIDSPHTGGVSYGGVDAQGNSDY